MVGMDTQEREAFLNERRTGIGGSDQAAIAGLSQWATPLDVYLQKIGADHDGETSDAAQRGIDLEPVLMAAYEMKVGRAIERTPAMLRHAQHPELLCHLDGRDIADPSRIIEGKTSRNPEDWANGAPTPYALQAQHNMLVAEATICDLPALIATEEAFTVLRRWFAEQKDVAVIARFVIESLDFRIVTIERDEEMADALKASALEFWHDHVLPRVPPPIRSVDDARKLWPQSKPASIEATDQIVAIEADLREIEVRMDVGEKALAQFKASIHEFMGENDTLTYQGRTLRTWKTQKASRFDSTAFKAAHPDLVEKFTISSTNRVFRKSK